MTSFLDQVERSPSLRTELFPLSFKDQAQRRSAVLHASTRRIPVPVLDALRAQNPNSPSLTRLEGPCAMVITGQQLGLLGGPLFTLYKIATAIAFARQLESESGVPVIPLFWLQSEDHDYTEIRSATLVSRGGELLSLSLPENPPGLGNSVGNFVIDSASAATFAAAIHQHFDAQSAPEDVKALVSAYSAGATLTSAMASYIRHYFATHGLLVLNAHEPRIKAYALPFLEQFFDKHQEVERALRDREALLTKHQLPITVALREGYPLPFIDLQGRRERILFTGTGQFQTSLGPRSSSALRSELTAHPERCSTSALARPLFQDFLLPSAAYVAGPSELAYWGQLSGLYRLLGVSMPLVVPRTHFALVTKKIDNVLSREQWQVEDLALSNQELVLKQRTGLSDAPDKVFGEAEEAIATIINNLAATIAPLEHTQLSDGLALTKGSMLANLAKLKGRYSRVITERASTITARMSRLRKFLYPTGQPQERVVSSAQFTLLEGKIGIQRLIESALPSAPATIQRFILSSDLAVS